MLDSPSPETVPEWKFQIFAIFASIVFIVLLIGKYFLVAIPICFGVGIVFMILYLIQKEKVEKSTNEKLYKRLWFIFWILPAIFILMVQVMFLRLFGWLGFAILVAGGAAGVFLMRDGHVVIPVACTLPLIYLLRFALFAGNFVAPVLAVIVIALIVYFRNVRWRWPVVVRFIIFAIMCSTIYSAGWYLWPGFGGAQETGDPAVKHIAAFEKEAARVAFPREFYSVVENCSGDTLYLTNLFNSPGIFELERGTEKVNVYRNFKGVTEQVAFDCNSNMAYFAEYKTGKFFKVDADSIDRIIGSRDTDIKKPCRIYKNPDSKLIFVNADQASFPWFVLNTKGRELLKFEFMQVEEVVPLPDESFIVVYDGRIHHARLGRMRDEFVVISETPLPEKGLAAMRVGPLYQHLAYDEVEKALYISDFNTGRIYKSKMPSIEIQVLAEPGRNIRHIAYSPAYKVVAAGNFVSGELFIIDSMTGETVFKHNIGSRLRGVTVSRDGKRVYAVSRRGIFEIDLAKILSGNR